MQAVFGGTWQEITGGLQGSKIRNAGFFFRKKLLDVSNHAVRAPDLLLEELNCAAIERQQLSRSKSVPRSIEMLLWALCLKSLNVHKIPVRKVRFTPP